MAQQVLAVVIVLALGRGDPRALLGRYGWSFSASAVVAALVPVWVFACLWPNVLPARNSSRLSLTVHNASSRTTRWA